MSPACARLVAKVTAMYPGETLGCSDQAESATRGSDDGKKAEEVGKDGVVSDRDALIEKETTCIKAAER